ncbi:MAG: hypothetical protein WCI76_03455 [bacterium]
MSKQSTIKNLLAIPLLASAILLANPALAANTTQSVGTAISQVKNINNEEATPNTKKSISGVVTSVSGKVIIVETKNGTNYAVDVASATIMKASKESSINPSIIHSGNIKAGDLVIARGVVKDAEWLS